MSYNSVGKYDMLECNLNANYYFRYYTNIVV